MAEEVSLIEDCVKTLKAKIPASEHGALDSRAEELMNDPSADEDDVVAILKQEFYPSENR